MFDIDIFEAEVNRAIKKFRDSSEAVKPEFKADPEIKNSVATWLNLAKVSPNLMADSEFSHNLIHKFISAKHRVERWDLVVTDWIFHPAHIEVLNLKLKNHNELAHVNTTLWGIKFNFTDQMPIDIGLAIARPDERYNNIGETMLTVCTFPM